VKKTIQTDKAPAAIGPYSQCVVCHSYVFTAGQIAIDPASGQLTGKNVAEQTAQVLENLKAVLAAANTSLDNVIKTTVFLTRNDDFSAMNEVYGLYFTANFPARTTVFVSALPKNAMVEIEAVAEL
jgi:2-iminobutanoate/2-iminopropanoate deaminase